MKELTINDILTTEDKKFEEVEIPEWGGVLFVRVMTAKERSEIEDLYLKVNEAKKDTGKFRRELIKRTLCNSKGESLITDDAIAEHMMGKSALIIERLFEKACEVNGFRERDVDTLKKK